MLTNQFKIAFRNLKRHKAYTAINIIGLAVGMAASLLIFIITRYELGYNRFFPAYNTIYHVVTKTTGSEGTDFNAGVPYPLLDALRIDFPQLKIGAAYAVYGTQVTIPDAASGKKFITDSGVFFCDPQFFDVFSYKWVKGNPSVLKEPNTVVLTKKLAAQYFGNWKNAIGQTLKVNNAMDFQVAGILEDVPANTDYKLGMVGSLITIRNNRYYGYTDDWGTITSNFQVFMQVPAAVTEASIEKRLDELADKYYKNKTAERSVSALQPLSDVHFNTQISSFGDHISSRSSLLTLAMIGLLIIVMACINFINLSTAQAVTRSKEIGVRKVLGSNRLQLFLQVLSETNIIVLFAATLALLLVKLALPFIGNIISIEETLALLTSENILFILLTIFGVTFLSGFYPALILSGFKPVVALKNKISSATIGGISLRRGLVVTQFVISQILIAGTIVAVSQMNFIRTADLGFNKEAVVVINSSSDSSVVAKHSAFKEALTRLPYVKTVTLCSDVPSSDNNSSTNFAFDHKPDEAFSLYLKFTDADYFKTFALEFMAGEGYAADDTSRKVVINETLVKKLKIKNADEAIGKQIRTGGGRWRTIMGVVKDFKTNSLREEVKPLMLSQRKDYFSSIAVKLERKNLAGTQAALQKEWDKFYPEYAFDSWFVDESIERFYQQEQQLALLFKIFSGLAIFISCLGLYGLVSFMAVQKTKEVGVRKVLGAGVGNIILLFSKEFTLLILIAFLIAGPAAWFFMNKWLENFVFRIHIGWQVFAIAVGVSIIVSWLSVGYKALQAALVNPVKSLRTE